MKQILFFGFFLISRLAGAQYFFTGEDSIQTGKFAEGVKAKVVKDKMFFVDASEKQVSPIFDFPAGSSRIPFFNEGFCAFYEKDFQSGDDPYEEPYRYGFLNRNFEIIIPARFPRKSEFNCEGHQPVFKNGFAIVDYPGSDSTRQYQYALIDKTGEMVGDCFNAVYGCTAACEFSPEISDGFVATSTRKGYAYLDIASGKIVMEGKFTIAGPFSEGLAVVQINDEYFIIIDKTGKQVMNKRFYTRRRGKKETDLYIFDRGCNHPGGFVKGKLLLEFYDNNGKGGHVMALIDKSGQIVYSRKIKDYPESEFDSDPRLKEICETYSWKFGEP